MRKGEEETLRNQGIFRSNVGPFERKYEEETLKNQGEFLRRTIPFGSGSKAAEAEERILYGAPEGKSEKYR